MENPSLYALSPQCGRIRLFKSLFWRHGHVLRAEKQSIIDHLIDITSKLQSWAHPKGKASPCLLLSPMLLLVKPWLSPWGFATTVLSARPNFSWARTMPSDAKNVVIGSFTRRELAAWFSLKLVEPGSYESNILGDFGTTCGSVCVY